jgi:hypothetical protein
MTMKITRLFMAIGVLCAGTILFSLNANAGGLTDFIRSGDLETVLELIDNDNVNEVDENGMTPLMVAVSIGDLEITAVLIDAGADVNKKGEKEAISETPYSIAAWEQNYDILDILLQHEANDPWMCNIPGFDPYDLYPYIFGEDDYDEHPGWYEGTFDEYSDPYMVIDVDDRFVNGPCDGSITHNIFRGASGYEYNNDRYHYSQYSDGVLVENYISFPSYVAPNGIVYPQGVHRTDPGGPYVDIMVTEHTQRVKSAQMVVGNDITELVEIDRGVYFATVGPVDECEPIIVQLKKQNGDVVASYELLSELRGAVPGAVSIYMSRWPGNSGLAGNNDNNDDNDNHGNNGNHGNHGNNGGHGNRH